jgi:hypothetical protein
LDLGRQGENLARTVVFRVSDWQEAYGPGIATLLAQRPGEETPYPCVVIADGDTIFWPVTAADTARSGAWGKCELQYRVNDALVKSERWSTCVSASLDQSEEETPEAHQGWVAQVVEAGVQAREAEQTAQAAAQIAREADINAEAASAQAQAAQAGAEVANEQAQTARTGAEAAQKKAQTAQTAAETAKGQAQTAQTAAETAKGQAQTAQAAAETAKGQAQTAQAAAETAKGQAQTAQAAAETAKGQAQTARTAAEAAQQQATAAQTGAEAARTGAETAARNAAETAAQTAAQTAAESVVARVEKTFTKVLRGTASGEGIFLSNADDAPILDRTVMRGNTVQASLPTYAAPVAVQSVSGPIKLRVSGKNLLTLETATKAGTAFGVSWVIADGKITLSGTCSRPGSYAFVMPLGSAIASAVYFPAGNYVLSGLQADYADQSVRLYVNVYNAAGTALGTYGTYGRTGVAFTLSEGAWLTVNIRVADGTVTDGIVVYPQIEAGQTQTDYEAYCGQTYAIPLVGTDGQALEELRMLYGGSPTPKTTYTDRICCRNGKWMIERNTASRVLTDATWSGGANYMTPSLGGVNIRPGVVTYHALCNHFASRAARSSDAQSAGIWVGNMLVIGNDVLPNGAATTAAEMVDFCAKQAAAGTPVKVYYPVATPTYEELGQEAQAVLNSIRTKLGKTALWGIGTVRPTLALEYAKSLSMVLDNLATAIVAVGGTI